MKDCYKILGVPHTATIAEIRHAYRKKAKLLHPDVSGKDPAAFQELNAAYQTLSDLKTKELFDESFAFKQSSREFYRKTESTFDYRTWLLERTEDEFKAKLIFYDLMHNREDDAVAEFKQMNMSRPGFKLSKWFTREDFMDYGFILSEELVLRQEYYDAVILLEQVIRMEFSYSHFKLFFPEVKSLARHILRNNIENTVSPELAIDSWERALELEFGNADDAFFLHKMGEAYEKIGDRQTASICFEESYRLGGR